MPDRIDTEVSESPAATAMCGRKVWPELLLGAGRAHDDAVRRLHTLMIKAARHQVRYMYPTMPIIGGVRVDDLVSQAADEATVAALGKLSDFEGRSRFTTWAYKFGILHASNEVRRNMWKHREIDIDGLREPVGTSASPEQHVEQLEFVEAITLAINTVLTPHQRQVAVGLLVDDIPIDVLAERLGSTRNALYKTLFDARRRLRVRLTADGFLAEPTTMEVS
ncbi:MAG: sigma-70 family RNA polymerase sigma factor [Ilumatobacteraceae bacterium]